MLDAGFGDRLYGVLVMRDVQGFAICLGIVCVAVATAPREATAAPESGQARWIWTDAEDPAPKNRFTYFRKTFTLDDLPANATVRFAADSNAMLWINGHIVRRKVARYHEPHITCEVINAAPFLRRGQNVCCVLHHNWGDIITFQRTANRHAGLYVNSPFVKSDYSWRCTRAPEFQPHEKQILGVIQHARIRYPLIVDMQKAFASHPSQLDFDDSAWSQAMEVQSGPWPVVPDDVETPGQREFGVAPLSILAAGSVELQQPLSEDPLSMSTGIRTARYRPNQTATVEAAKLLAGKPCVIEGQAGETHYMTVDFGRPIHGYPILKLADAPAGTWIDVGYAEIAHSLRTGEAHVKPDGWINPEGVVGPGYADRCVTKEGSQKVEFPDERTARWLTVQIHFKRSGRVVLQDVGFVTSQYPLNWVGSFSCGDERIDQIVKLCQIHAEITMTDAYVDTPGREDGQWIEDDRPRALLAARWFGDTQLRALFIRTHAEGQGEDGNLHPFAPSNFPAYPAVYDWSVQWVAAIYDDYLWTGNTELVNRYWSNVCRYWDLVLSHVDEEGVWKTEQVLADIRVGVHVEKPTQSSGIVTPWIIERLRWSVAMAKAIGDDQRAGQWESVAQQMARAFRKHHLVPAAKDMPAHVADRFDPDNPDAKRGYSQAGQTIAVYTRLLTYEEAARDLDYAFPAPDGSPPAGVTRWNNPTYSYRVLRALSDTGRAERAVAHLIERYAPYLPANPRNPVPLVLQGPYGGPLPEYWVNREDLQLEPGKNNPAQPDDETGSHGWGAVPLLWLHDSLLGVRITEPGGGRLRIAPDAGGLPFVAGHTGTPKGVVWVYWDPQTFTLQVTLPEGVIADLMMPAACAEKRIRVVRSSGEVKPGDAPRAFTVSGGGEYEFQVR